MSRYLITYDEHKHHNYDALYRLMASWHAVHLANSVWLADLNGTATAVRDVVARTLHSADTIAVIELKQGSGWATRHVASAANTWLSANITPSQQAA
jgi:hypothetical protein